MANRAIVAAFVKWGSDPTRLWSFTLFKQQDGYRSRTEYDVEWSRQYGCYLYHMSGGGGGDVVEARGPYHVSGDVAVRERAPQWVSARDRPPWKGKRTLNIQRRNTTRRLRQLPMSFSDMKPGWDLLDWLKWNAIETDAVYCSACDDWLPDTSNAPCDHVWWCDKNGWWSTPSERCKCKDREECYDNA
jgi:hypothetical protein